MFKISRRQGGACHIHRVSEVPLHFIIILNFVKFVFKTNATEHTHNNVESLKPFYNVRRSQERMGIIGELPHVLISFQRAPTTPSRMLP